MKKTVIHAVLAAALLGMTAAQAGEFDGSWVGGKIGSNTSGMTGVDRKNATGYGLEGGHSWNMGNGFLLGVDGFVDFNGKATHNPGAVNYGSNVYGLDAKLGIDAGNWLPYAKIGYARTNGNGAASAIGSSDAHLGLGVEYKLAPNWSLAGEFTSGRGKSIATRMHNNNLSLGINYYFGAPAPVAAAPAPVAAPVPTPAVPAPVVKAAPKETWKTLLEEKPVTIEGANFDFDSAKIRPAAVKKLSEVVEFAATYGNAQLEVSGHTDSTGKNEYNQKLSEQRATAVSEYLVKKGVAANRIVTKGYGETRPVVDNKTAKGRAQNRRVEIRSVLKEEKKIRVIE
ncbi:MAG: OmpA family protein [Gallionella sp.]